MDQLRFACCCLFITIPIIEAVKDLKGFLAKEDKRSSIEKKKKKKKTQVTSSYAINSNAMSSAHDKFGIRTKVSC